MLFESGSVRRVVKKKEDKRQQECSSQKVNAERFLVEKVYSLDRHIVMKREVPVQNSIGSETRCGLALSGLRWMRWEIRG